MPLSRGPRRRLRNPVPVPDPCIHPQPAGLYAPSPSPSPSAPLRNPMSPPAAGFYGPVADHARTPGRSRGTTRQQRALTGAAHVLPVHYYSTPHFNYIQRVYMILLLHYRLHVDQGSSLTFCLSMWSNKRGKAGHSLAAWFGCRP